MQYARPQLLIPADAVVAIQSQCKDGWHLDNVMAILYLNPPAYETEE